MKPHKPAPSQAPNVFVPKPARPPQPAAQADALVREECVQLIGLFNAGRYPELEARARVLTAQHPALGFAWKILGTALLVQGKDGAEALQKAVALLPGDVEAHSNLGNVLKDQGRLDEAVASYRRALAIKPDFLAAHFNLGIALNALGQNEAAVDCYRRALALNPGLADAHFNLGIAIQALGRMDEAVASYQKALGLNPKHMGAHCNLGLAMRAQGRYEAAVACYRQVLAIQPDFVDALNNLGNLLKDLGQLEEALACFRRALALKPAFTESYSNLLFTHNYVPDQGADLLLTEAKAYGDLVASQAHPYTSWPNMPDADRQLHIGLVSGDLCQHPVGYFIEGVLAALTGQAAERLAFHVYATHADHDALTQRLKAHCASWSDAAGLSDQTLAERVRGDGIDILIDLSGHTAYNRLPMFAWKPAPVQLSWLGYFATTGVAAIDYLLADPWTLPEDAEAHFTERIWRLPETRFCFTPPDTAVPVTPLPALVNGHITFGCFNNLTKMNDGVVALWARVLHCVAGSRLFLKAKQLDEPSVRESIMARFAAQGIAADRLTLEGRSPRADYLSAYGRVDIGLDPFPFTGGTTSAESLWMGVPVLTLAGDRLVSRQGVALLANAGLPDWIAKDGEAYVQCAATMAADLPALAALRQGLRPQVLASPIFDAPRFAGFFDTALREMWSRWCRGSHQP